MSEGVALLHGFDGLSIQTALLARRLSHAGYPALNPLCPSRGGQLVSLLHRLRLNGPTYYIARATVCAVIAHSQLPPFWAKLTIRWE